MFRKFLALTAVSLAIASFVMAAPDAEARRHSSSHSTPHSSRSSHSSTRSSSRSSSSSRSHRGRVTHTVVSSRHHGRHHTTTVSHHRGRHSSAPKAAAKPRYAYPLELFMLAPPDFDQTPFEEVTAHKIKREFDKGIAERYKATDLVRAGLATYHPIHGGVFYRREPVKYIIVHSTETGPPVSATSVIDAWSSLGRRHAGAQFVVERDGKIFLACDPDLATVHVNIFKTLPGINNDNSIGIEMNHTGKQTYPRAQRESVKKLVSYLQDHYHVANENVITHRYAQQGDHTDPVAFDFDEFLAEKDEFHNKALAMKRDWLAPPPIPTETVVIPAAAPAAETATSTVVPSKAPEAAPTTALTPKATESTAAPFGVPLPGPPALRKEIEMSPAALEAEKKEDAKLENELEPMQQVP